MWLRGWERKIKKGGKENERTVKKNKRWEREREIRGGGGREEEKETERVRKKGQKTRWDKREEWKTKRPEGRQKMS